MSAQGIRDPFAGQQDERLGFLSTPTPLPRATVTVLRGSSRIFEPAQRAGANEVAAASRAVEPASSVGHVTETAPAPAALDADPAPDATSMFGVDLNTLSVEQLSRLMTACGIQMMRSMVRQGGSWES